MEPGLAPPSAPGTLPALLWRSHTNTSSCGARRWTGLETPRDESEDGCAGSPAPKVHGGSRHLTWRRGKGSAPRPCLSHLLNISGSEAGEVRGGLLATSPCLLEHIRKQSTCGARAAVPAPLPKSGPPEQLPSPRPPPGPPHPSCLRASPGKQAHSPAPTEELGVLPRAGVEKPGQAAKKKPPGDAGRRNLARRPEAL